MKKNSVNYEGDVKDLMFEEEVPETSLVSKKHQNDIIYVNTGLGKFNRIVLYVLLFLILGFSVLSLLFNFFGSHHRFIGKEGADKDYVLNVIQSNNYYGASEIDFSKHNSYKKAYTYNFRLKNSNSRNLDYSINLVNPNFNLDSVNMKNISYKFIKNNKVVKEGNLTDIDIYNLYSSKIKSNSVENYTLKLWSSKIDSNKLFSFKIDVTL